MVCACILIGSSRNLRLIQPGELEKAHTAERDFPSGFVIQELEIGVGKLAVAKKKVSISYTARLMDNGRIIESYTKKAPFIFQPDYTFKQAEEVKVFLKNPSKFASTVVAVAQSGGQAAPAKEEAKKEPEEESDDDQVSGLFD